MASIAMMIGGAVLNAAETILQNFLAGDNGQAALDEKTRHDKALEAYQAAMAKYSRERTQLLDCVETNREIKEHAQKSSRTPITRSSSTIKRTPTIKLTMPREPKFSDMYQPSSLQKQGPLRFVGGGALALAYAAFPFL